MPDTQSQRDDAREPRNRRGVALAGGGALVMAALLILVAAMAVPGDGPRNMASDGIRIGEGLQAVSTKALAAGEQSVPTAHRDGAVEVRVYLDYRCLQCADFEEENGEQLGEWVESGAVQLEIHPLGWLGADSVTAANAAACVADLAPDDYLGYHRALLQRADEDIDDDLLTALAVEVGAPPTDEVGQCIESGRFDQWVQDSTLRARTKEVPGLDGPLRSAPTVVVDDEVVPAADLDAAAFDALVDSHLPAAAR